jgi:hypothetical protein
MLTHLDVEIMLKNLPEPDFNDFRRFLNIVNLVVFIGIVAVVAVIARCLWGPWM